MKYTTSLILALLATLFALGQTIEREGSICTEGSTLLSIVPAPAPARLQWLLNGNAVAGATGLTFRATTYGSYSVEIEQGGQTKTLTPLELCDKPAVTIGPINDLCRRGTISPTATVNTCGGGTPTYAWRFQGGTPAASSSATPGAISYASPGSYTIELTVTNDCGSTTATTTLLVHAGKPEPPVVPPAGQLVCAGTIARYTFSSNLQGSTFRWRNDNRRIGLAPSGTGSAMEFEAKTTKDEVNYEIGTIRVFAANACGESDASSFTVYVQYAPPELATNEIRGTQTVCAGSRPQPITGTEAAPLPEGLGYQWESSADGNTWSPVAGARGKDYQPQALQQTSWFRRQTLQLAENTQCGKYSAAIKITVLPRPVLTTPAHQQYCAQSNVPAQAFAATPQQGINYTWTNSLPAIGLPAQGTGSLPSFTATNNSANATPLQATITVTPVATTGNQSCSGDAVNFTISVLPFVKLQPIADQQWCSGSQVPALVPQPVGSADNASLTYSWSLDGHAIGLAAGRGSSIAAFTAAGPSTSQLQATVTVSPIYTGNGASCNGEPAAYRIRISPPPAQADAGADVQLCAATTHTLQATPPPAGSTGAWRQTAGPAATINSPSNAGSTISGLQAGATYKFAWTLGSTGGCPATTDEVTITVSQPITNTIQGAAIQACAGTELTVQGQPAGGGNGSFTYQWQFSAEGTAWSDIRGGNGQTLRFTPTASGNIRRMVIAGGCSSTSQQLPVGLGTPPQVTIIADNTACADAPVTLRAGVQPGTVINRLEWILPDGSQQTGNTATYTFSEAGNYSVALTAIATGGCTGTANHAISISETPVTGSGTDATICPGQPYQLQATGASRYQWRPANGLSCTDCPNPTATITQPAIYVVTGTNMGGCTAMDTIRLEVQAPPAVMVSGIDSICPGSTTRLLASGADRYQWLPAAGLSATNTASVIAAPATTTTYQVIGWGAAGCGSDTATITISVGTAPLVTAGPDQRVAPGSRIQLQARAGAAAVRNWNWTPATGLSCTACPAPFVLVTDPVTYIVQATTAYGCTASDTINITLLDIAPRIDLPDAFTPNGDGRNDLLVVRGMGLAQVRTFRVFNRWGNLVYEQKSFAPNDRRFGWNGTLQQRAGSTETFVIIVEAATEGGQHISLKKTVTVIR